MIVNAKRRMGLFAGAIVLGIIVAYIFTTIAPIFKVHPAPFELTVVVEFLCGFLVAVAIGMLFNEDSRFNGLIYAIVFAAVPYFYVLISPGANIDLLIMMFSSGFSVGIITDIFCVSKNHFDKLAHFAKIMVTLFYLMILLFLLYELSFVIMDNTGDASWIQYTIIYGAGILLVSLLYWIALKVTIGVRASDIFIFGPPNSGKTFFAVGLMNYIMQNENGRTFSYPLNPEDSELTLESLSTQILNDELKKRTHPTQMVMHKLEVQKYGIFPIRWTVVDYAGEYYNQLNYTNYTKAIEYLSEQLPDDVMDCIGTEEFVIKISREHADKLKDPSFTKSAIIAATYGNFLKAGKVIFIVDGEKVNRTENNGDVDTTSLLSDLQIYNSIVSEIVAVQDKGRLSKLLKKYAIVVTKTDLVLRNNGDIREMVGLIGAQTLSKITENSKESRIIEEAIYEKLNERGGLAFTNLIRWIGNEIPLHFIAVSADATTNAINDQPRGRTMPWGYSQIFKFGR